MATITVYNSARMKQIEDETIISGHMDGDDLILETRAGNLINAGDTRGEKGDKGDQGDVSLVQLNSVADIANAAQNTANSALSQASNAMDMAAAAKVITRGSQVAGTLKCEWLQMTNGIQMVWGEYRANTSLAWSSLNGNIYSAIQPMFILKPFMSGKFPSIMIGSAQHSALGGSWGVIEAPAYNQFQVRMFAAGPRNTNQPILLTYFAIGYYKTPTA